ncbi:MAG: alpha/beta hydrolase [Acidimicrobiia bacterium]|nr:alpha/beta hydrolase [Acidimicrobiia bacterium]
MSNPRPVWRSRLLRLDPVWLRVFGELAAFVVALPFLLLLPRGHGQPVLVIPAYTASDTVTIPLRLALRLLGYRPSGWDLGVNGGLSDAAIAASVRRLEELHRRHDVPVDVVGWSLGGVFGRHLARVRSDMVGQVITLGSPLRSMEAKRGWAPPDVPTTSIYSKSDSVVDWTDSVDDPGPGRENVEVRGTHYGLAHNPRVIVVVADRLAKDPATPASLD